MKCHPGSAPEAVPAAVPAAGQRGPGQRGRPRGGGCALRPHPATATTPRRRRGLATAADAHLQLGRDRGARADRRRSGRGGPVRPQGQAVPPLGHRPLHLAPREPGHDESQRQQKRRRRNREVFYSPASHLNLRFSVAICPANVEHSEKCTFSSQISFQSSILGVQNEFQIRNDSPPHISPNLQIKMPIRKLRSEMGLLNTLQEAAAETSTTPSTTTTTTSTEEWTRLRARDELYKNRSSRKNDSQ